jgi:MBG domain (YGX type)/Right handed beta helix region
MTLDSSRFGQTSIATRLRWRRRPLAAASAVVLLATVVSGVAVVEAQSASAATTFWAAPEGFGDCTEPSPCGIQDAVAAVNAAGGGTVDVLGDPNTPYDNPNLTFTVPATIEAAPGSTPVFHGNVSHGVIEHSAALTVRGLDIYGAAAPISSAGVNAPLTVVDSYLHDNVHDAIDERSNVTVRNSTIYRNGGSGINTDTRSPIHIVASTIADNGIVGIFAFDPIVISSTIVDNGVNLDVGSLTLAGSIIAGGSPDCVTNGFYSDLGGNIAGDASCPITAPSSVSSSPDIRASLKAFDFNGGTPSFGLAAGSPAIGLVPGTVSAEGSVLCAQPDQRGLPRPSSACDAGAYQTGNTMSVTMTAPSVSIVYGEEIPYLQPSDPTGTRLRSAASCTTINDYPPPVGSYPTSCAGAAASSDVTFHYVDGTLAITKALLAVRASDESMSAGGPVPTITAVYDDYDHWFQYDDTPDVLDTPPTCTTTATVTSPPGDYPSSCSGGADNNYTFTYVDGTVQVRDTTPPVTSIDSGPSGPINVTTVTYTFSASEPGSTFQCLLIGGPGTWTTCVSPKTYSNLADGSYTFYVGARDAAGNPDPNVPSRSFVVDTVPPTVSLVSPADGATYSQDAAVTAQYSCGYGSGSPLASCAGPVANGGAVDTSTPGTHRFTVTATDQAGNTNSATASYTVRATQSILWMQQGPYAYGHAPVTLTASATSGLLVSYVVTSGPCWVAGSTLSITGVGVCALTASQAGNNAYLPAQTVSQSITIGRAPTQLVAATAKVGLLRATYSATLTSLVTGQPIAGQTITFSRPNGNSQCTATTDVHGVASCSHGGLFLGKVSYIATYAGNALYLPSTDSP